MLVILFPVALYCFRGKKFALFLQKRPLFFWKRHCKRFHLMATLWFKIVKKRRAVSI